MQNEPLIGAKVVAIRQQTTIEMAVEGWDKPAIVLVFDNGATLFASSDEEGNNPGALFGVAGWRDGSDGVGKTQAAFTAGDTFVLI